MSPLMMLNDKIKTSMWYMAIYGDRIKFKKRQFNLAVVNLGSGQSKYAFDYSGESIKAANWAVSTQSLSYDFKILKNYSSFIKNSGFVLLVLCPFTGFEAEYKDQRRDVKYHAILHPILVRNFSEITYERMKKEIKYPLPFSFIYNFLPSVKTILKNPLNKTMVEHNPMDDEQLKTDAQKWVANWKKEFDIVNFSDQFSEENKNAIKYNTNLLCEIAYFCKERSFKLILIVPPVTTYLSNLLPDVFFNRAFYTMFDRVKNEEDIRILDYFKSPLFSDADLYYNALLFNIKGRKMFTKQVLRDIGLIE